MEELQSVSELESVRIRLAEVEARISEIGAEYESSFKEGYVNTKPGHHWFFLGMDMARSHDTKKWLTER